MNYASVNFKNDNSSVNNDTKFAVFRCPDPVAVKTEGPWYNYENICPCDPSLSYPTGRGFTACPYGIFDQGNGNGNGNGNLSANVLKDVQQSIVAGLSRTGNNYNDYQVIPPQMDPRPLTRIGQQWRSGN
jgi:hypothetical protein